jgi:hypothetical protein
MITLGNLDQCLRVPLLKSDVAPTELATVY